MWGQRWVWKAKVRRIRSKVSPALLPEAPFSPNFVPEQPTAMALTVVPQGSKPPLTPSLKHPGNIFSAGNNTAVLYFCWAKFSYFESKIKIFQSLFLCRQKKKKTGKNKNHFAPYLGNCWFTFCQVNSGITWMLEWVGSLSGCLASSIQEIGLIRLYFSSLEQQGLFGSLFLSLLGAQAWILKERMERLKLSCNDEGRRGRGV